MLGSGSNSNVARSFEITDDVRLLKQFSLGDVTLCFGPLTDVETSDSDDLDFLENSRPK